MKLHTLAALLASTIAAAAVAAPSTATSTLPPGVKDMSPDQIDYNLQAIDAAAKEQQELARQKEAARAAAQAAAQEAAAKEKQPLRNVRLLPLEPKHSSKLRRLRKKPLVRLSLTHMRTRFANLNFK